jgi:GrpB-like predicted nucleotidyltransferase (UPF0157 family)
MAILSPHDPSWASEFDELRALFAQALGPLALRVEHVGSTAIADLLAKPILDIDIVIPDYSVFPQVVRALGSLGCHTISTCARPLRVNCDGTSVSATHFELEPI